MKQFKLLSALIVFFTFQVHAHNSAALPPDYSDTEGVLDPKHNQDMHALRDRFFLNQDGAINPDKIRSLISFLAEKRQEVAESSRMSKKQWLIETRFEDDKEATKSSNDLLGKEAQELAPFDFATEYAQQILQTIGKNPDLTTDSSLRQKVETALMFVSAAYTITQTHFFSKDLKLYENVYHNFYDLKINDYNELQASNLVLNGNYLSQKQIREFRKKGGDISKLDPPSSSIWFNNKVEDYDPTSEVFYDHKLFPPKSEEIPEFYFKKMGWGTIKLKAYWLDQEELNSKGKPKKRDVTLRLGWEAYTSVVTNHLSRIIGYHSNSTAYRAKVKLYLEDVTYEEFVSKWFRAHPARQGGPVTYVERIPGEPNAVYLYNVCMEAFPEDDQYRKMGPFRMARNGFTNRREYRAMLLYNGFVNLQDTGEGQVRVDALKNQETGLWNPLFMISDTGIAMSLLIITNNTGTPNEYPRFFTSRTDKNVWIWWMHGDYDPKSWLSTTYSDAKWLARRFARISEKQLQQIMDVSGFPDPLKLLYVEKMKGRINNIIENFDLHKEGFQYFTFLSDAELHNRYPEYIDEKGYLKSEAQEMEGNRLPIMGNRYTTYQKTVVNGLGILQKLFLDAIGNLVSDPIDKQVEKIEIGEKHLSSGTKILGSRELMLNSERGPGQKRYLIKDSYTIGIPIGIDTKKVETPLAIYYYYTYEYYHSVTNPSEVGYKKFFNTLNPASIVSIRKNLGLGEQLRIRHSFGTSVGQVRIEFLKDLRFDISIFGADFSTVKDLYFSKTSNDTLEITHAGMHDKEFSTGLDSKALIRIAAQAKKSYGEKHYTLYRLDLLDKTEKEQDDLESGFNKALIDNDFSWLDSNSKTYRLHEGSKKTETHFALGIWGWDKEREARTLDIEGDIQDIQPQVSSDEKNITSDKRTATVYTASSFAATDRALDRLWTDKVSLGLSEGVVDYFTAALGEGKSLNITLDAVANADYTDFAETETNFHFFYFDNWASREEYDKEFRAYFNQVVGDVNYMDYRMPKEIRYYSPLISRMRWQTREVGLKNILEGILKKYSSLKTDSYAFQVRKIRDLLAPLPTRIPVEKRKELLRKKAEDIVRLLRQNTGSYGTRMAKLRAYAGDENIWIYNRVDQILERIHPTFENEKDLFYFPKEIGHFQGHGFLDRLRAKKYIRPSFSQGQSEVIPANTGFFPQKTQ